jgi:hypothetical protein
VYQASTRQMTLYVDGVQQGSPVTRNTPWSATGPTMIGALRWYGMTVNFLNGDVDEVRLYNRALAGGEITDIVNQDQAGTPVRHWPGHRGAGLALDGVSGAASTTTAVLRSDQSFTVAAWVNLSQTDAEYTVISQQGGDGTAYALKYEPKGDGDLGEYGGWCFTVDESLCIADGHTGAIEVSQGIVDPTNTWMQLTATYDSFTHRITLRLGGAFTAERHGYRDVPPNVTGPMQIGRDLQGVDDGGTLGYEDYLPGTVDEVNTFAGVLDETGIEQLIANS